MISTPASSALVTCYKNTRKRQSGTYARATNTTHLWVANHLHPKLRSVSHSHTRKKTGTYVHNRDPSLVQLLNRALRGYTDSTHEERGLLVNNNIQEIRQLSLCIVILHTKINQPQRLELDRIDVNTNVGFACATSNLREEQVHTIRRVLIVQLVFNFTDL